MAAWSVSEGSLVRKLAEVEKLSAAQIAERLPGRTRNAIIGYASRNDIPLYVSQKDGGRMCRRPRRGLYAKKKSAASLASLPTTAPREVRVKIVPPTVSHLPPSSDDLVFPPQNEAVDLLQGHECKWPIGEPKQPDFHFCREPRQESFPYCPAHCHQAYRHD